MFNSFVVTVTKKGVIKKTEAKMFMNVRKTGIKAVGLRDDDELSFCSISSGNDSIIIATDFGQGIHFNESEIRAMGRQAAGVRGIRLKEGDKVVGMGIVDPEQEKNTTLLVVTSNGYGKQSPIKEYKQQSRGGSGIKTANVTKKTGEIIGSMILDDEVLTIKNDLMAISKAGQTIRLPLKSVSKLGRATQGVRIMRFKEPNDTVSSVTLV